MIQENNIKKSSVGYYLTLGFFSIFATTYTLIKLINYGNDPKDFLWLLLVAFIFYLFIFKLLLNLFKKTIRTWLKEIKKYSHQTNVAAFLPSAILLGIYAIISSGWLIAEYGKNYIYARNASDFLLSTINPVIVLVCIVLAAILHVRNLYKLKTESKGKTIFVVSATLLVICLLFKLASAIFISLSGLFV